MRLAAPIVAAVTARIVGITVSPDDPVAGERVTIAVAVHNDGLVAGNVPVTLHFPSADKRPETRKPRIAPGATAVVDFTWRTGRYSPGVHTFRLELGGASGDKRTFTVRLLAPSVDFAVREIHPISPSLPIVKGDWVEVVALVENLGPYGGRADVALYDTAGNRVMYEKSVSLESGESEIVEFTWKTLRYAAGEYQLQVGAEAEHDVDGSNNYSDYASATILTNRDVTVGFGGKEPERQVSGDAVKASIRSAPVYPQEIIAYDPGPAAVAELHHPTHGAAFDVLPPPIATKTQTLHQMAQTSVVKCVEYQSQTGGSQPRAVLCPAAPALVR